MHGASRRVGSAIAAAVVVVIVVVFVVVVVVVDISGSSWKIFNSSSLAFLGLMMMMMIDRSFYTDTERSIINLQFGKKVGGETREDLSHTYTHIHTHSGGKVPVRELN